MIFNCPLNPEDSVRDNHVYVPVIPLLQRGTKRRRNPAKRAPRVPLPTDILLRHKKIELYFYFLYMNGMPFLHTKSSNITFLTAENCTSKSADNIIKELNTFNSMYKARCFNIDVFHGDNRFNLNTLR